MGCLLLFMKGMPKMAEAKRKAYVSLEGQLDIYSYSRLEEALPNPAEVENVVLNLLRVTYLDSLAVGRLVAFRRDFIEAGGTPENLVVVLPKSGGVRRIFEITGLTRMFSVVEPSELVPSPH
jgi:anti-anti-sigma factor